MGLPLQALQFGQSHQSGCEFDLRKQPEVVVGNAVEVNSPIAAQPFTGVVENAAEAACRRPKLSRGLVRVVGCCILPVALDCMLDGRPQVSVPRTRNERLHVGEFPGGPSQTITTAIASGCAAPLLGLLHHGLHPVGETARSRRELFLFSDQRFRQRRVKAAENMQNSKESVLAC
ncbi:MAG: hypothetical protein QOJ99_2502 [Bryobacterales bacterium]|nr:hypothetical protein [Bryobacterales bacterium]